MAMKMRIETPIAFVLTLTVCLVLFFYCWRIRKIRNRLTRSVQVSALPIAEITVPAEEQTGIEKEVIATFPTVNSHELKDDIKEGCPICLVEYTDTEVLRKLPLCGHVFHIRCVDSWLESQVTCPVCRIVLTGANFSKISLNRSRAPLRQNNISVEVPAWVLVNRPVPLPPAIADSSSSTLLHSSSESEPRNSDHLGVSPLLLDHHTTAGWGAVYLENHPSHGFTFRTSQFGTQLLPPSAGMIQSRECIHHASISERWMTESFVFGISGSEANSDQSSVDSASWDSLNVIQPTMLQCDQQYWQSTEEVLEVLECSRVAPFRPLTMSPERCSFEFLPIVTAGDCSFRSPRSSGWVGSSRHAFYSHL